MDEPTSSCFQASNANSAAGAAGPLHIRRATDGSYGVVPDQTVLPDAHAYRDCRNMRNRFTPTSFSKRLIVRGSSQSSAWAHLFMTKLYILECQT